MGDFVERAKNEAGIAYKTTGLNCAESIVRAFDNLCDLGIGENIKMATGFGGGLGRAGDMCGALSGSIIVLGAFRGRSNPPEGDRAGMYALSRGFHEKFSQTFGGTACDVVRRHEWGTREQRINCLKLISGTAGILAEYLIEKEIVKDS